MSILRLVLDEKPAGELVIRPSIPLDRALLCASCDSLFEAEGEQRCPACGSAQAVVVARALNRGAT
jgi:hypothetical protein